MTLVAMSDALMVGLIGAGIALFGTAVGAPFVNAWLQRRNQRAAAHEPAVGAARLIQREIEQGYAEAQHAAERGLDETPLPSAEWEQGKAVVASRLSQGELLVLDRYYAIVRHGAVHGILALYPTALQAINWLAEGKTNVVTPRKLETSLAPLNMDLPCECGHIFGHHGWRAVRRRVRFTHRHAKYKDVGFECNRCDCKKFNGVGKLIYI